MLEQGIVQLVQGTDTVTAIAPRGGYFVNVPEGQQLPSWTWQNISNTGDYPLVEKRSLQMKRLQIDCYGDPRGDGSDCLGLAKAIDDVLSGFSGVLEDPDQTIVDSCFQSDIIDFSDPDSRSFRRMLEYEIWFIQIPAG